MKKLLMPIFFVAALSFAACDSQQKDGRVIDRDTTGVTYDVEERVIETDTTTRTEEVEIDRENNQRNDQNRQNNQGTQNRN